MKVPKHISPDRIKDSVVEVKYSSKISFEVILGIFYQSLDETYMYTNRPIGAQQIAGPLPLESIQQFQIHIGNRPLFYNDKIKIELQPNSIIFNCVGKYISWDIYKVEIEKVLSQLSKSKVVDVFTRVGVRYISEYPNINLKDCVKFSFTFGLPEIKSDTYTFHSEFIEDDIKIILNLNNNLQVLNKKMASDQLDLSTISNIDVDVIIENLSEQSFENLLKKIDSAHSKEKEIFFSILREDFLLSLNPVY